MAQNLVCWVVIGASAVPCMADGAPLMRGALWWVTEPYYGWSQEQFQATLNAQKAVGFDLLWLLNCPALLQRAEAGAPDILTTLLHEADARGMQVIVDLPRAGWYGERDAASMISDTRAYVDAFMARYGKHPSFHGWYLNYEINPIAQDDTEQSAFWRSTWKGMVDTCHAASPGSVVTISPFFLLDAERRRGFVYQTPEEYEVWWGTTLRETGIDVLMLQDSGEHLGFFTLNDRIPFWLAAKRACREAGATFWLNVESAEVPVGSWDTYLAWEREGTVRYEVLPQEKLAAKLARAAETADAIVNWGYFPFMNPLEPEATAVDGAAAAYDSYKAYVATVRPK